ncbi:LytTR family transcriptional regulator [Pseudoflavitalea sp. G-6-1-2]|uniref:LytR/AlgR family response regulator transcription factor n=1 Tax=Pseudoflavitalea sp. G-6-1-2 TaxID=2728841 RepID=UPI001469A2D8|nr:LytTR family DNA-binding domain-containing protein [Pseudoflavitalea sp. G-6-1-2]NML22852.1 LytTR family transcriptional regulator [Pseudoflavitalea sp. G-6-1-2]
MQTFFFVKEQGRYVRVDFASILFIEARSNYVQIVTGSRVFMCLVSMRQIEKLLPADSFCRVHRSYIVGISSIQSFDKERIYLDDRMIPIGDRYRSALHRSVTMVRCKNGDSVLMGEEDESFVLMDDED